MISLARVSAKMGRTYYTQDSYYTKDISIEHSEWFGRGAATKELHGHVDTKVFQNLLDEHSKSKRAAIDLTFSAPKSVSLACLVNGDNDLLEAHKKAVDTALNVVEERFSYARTGSKTNRQVEISGNILAAKFLHDVSRAKDPQLHTHCVVFNQVQCADGKQRALHNDGIFNNSKLIGLVYQNELAHEVRKLGYEINVNANGTFEIEGYTRKQLDEFSKRTQHINKLECSTKKQERVEKLLDRPAKGKAVSREDLQEKWRNECHNINISHPSPSTRINISENVQFHIAKTNLVDGIDHVTEKDVRFQKEQVEKHVLTHNLGTVSWNFYDAAFSHLKKSDEVVEYKKGLFTTRSCIQMEENIVENIRMSKEKFSPISDAHSTIIAQHPSLTSGQKNAIATTLSSKDQFVAWQGVAGAGKTYALDILRSIAEEKQYKIKGFAQSAEAAQVLATEAKIQSETVSKLFMNSASEPKNSKLSNRDQKEIWVVDEAGLLGARDTSKLINMAIEQNARVIFVGDTKQMPSISAGNPFKLMQEHGISTAFLQESLRQKRLDLKQAVDLISRDQISNGLSKIQNSIYETKNNGDKIEFINENYMKLSNEERQKTLILSASNAERKQITHRIRHLLFQRNELKNEVCIKNFSPKQMTSQESKSILSYRPNDFLIFYKSHSSSGLECEKIYPIKYVDQKRGKIILSSLHETSAQEIAISPRMGGFICYEKKDFHVAVGDKIKCTKNDRYLGIRNGQDFTVTDTSNHEIILKSGHGKTLTFSTKYPLHLDHNYAQTVYSSQGKTSDRVIISGGQNFGKEMLYVAISRAKNDVIIVTQDKERFMKSGHISMEKTSAIKLVEQEKMKREMNFTLQKNREIFRRSNV